MYIHIYVHMYIHIRVQLSYVHIRTYMYIRKYVHTHLRTYVGMYVCTYFHFTFVHFYLHFCILFPQDGLLWSTPEMERRKNVKTDGEPSSQDTHSVVKERNVEEKDTSQKQLLQPAGEVPHTVHTVHSVTCSLTNQ